MQTSIIIKYQKKVLNIFVLSVIVVDSVQRKDKNYYLQVFSEEGKHAIKEKRILLEKFITDDIETSSDDSDKENSDEEN